MHITTYYTIILHILLYPYHFTLYLPNNHWMIIILPNPSQYFGKPFTLQESRNYHINTFVDPSLPPSLLPLRHGGFSDVIMMGRVTCHETVTGVTRLVLFTQSIGRAYPHTPEGIGAHAGNGKMSR